MSPIAEILWRRLTLWCGIVGRTNWGAGRVGPILAYRITIGVHPWSDVAKYRTGIIR